jgi:hypothetical protein
MKESLMATLQENNIPESPVIESPSTQDQASVFSDGPSVLPEELSERGAATALEAAPTLAPPTELDLEAAEEDGIAAWYNANVNVRIEADGMVHEIYVW